MNRPSPILSAAPAKAPAFVFSSALAILSTLTLALALIASFSPPSRAAEPSSSTSPTTPTSAPAPVPDKLVALTFDDSVKSHFTVVAPTLKRLGFGATFFITEGFNFLTDKTRYLTWDEIRELNAMGFEIGNHTRAHKAANAQSDDEFLADLEWIERRCRENGLPEPKSFAWPGNALGEGALKVLERKGYRGARRGGSPEFPYKEGRGRGYDPAVDHPLLIPTAGDARPFWTLDDFTAAARQARDGKIAVMQFHGVPDLEHPWVHTDPAKFEEDMNWLKAEGYKVVALRDLEKYADPKAWKSDPAKIIQAKAPPEPK